MTTYYVTVQETYSKTIAYEADSVEEAIDLASGEADYGFTVEDYLRNSFTAQVFDQDED